MTSDRKRRAAARSEWLRFGMFGLGTLMLIGAPVVGVLPGPGGVVLFGGGLALVLKNSHWAKKRYVRFKRRWPKSGDWADWGMRRASARRRAHRAKLAARAD